MKIDIFQSRSIPAAGPPVLAESEPQVFIQMTHDEMKGILSDLGDLDPARIGTRTKELTRLMKASVEDVAN
jgi:hypothetical protein